MKLTELPTRSPDGALLVVVESPRGSPVKLKYDPALGAFVVGRPLPLGLCYPHDWGFLPGTEGPDKDPLDAMVLWDLSTHPGVIVPCRALGLLQLEQDGQAGARIRNDRLLALPLEAPRYEGAKDIFELPERLRDELEKFFVDAVFFARKNPRILGWEGAEAAEAWVERSRKS